MWELKRKRVALTAAANAAVTQPKIKAVVAPAAPYQPKHKATKAAPVVWPVSLAMATMPLALPLRCDGTLVMMALRLGD